MSSEEGVCYLTETLIRRSSKLSDLNAVVVLDLHSPKTRDTVAKIKVCFFVSNFESSNVEKKKLKGSERQGVTGRAKMRSNKRDGDSSNSRRRRN